MTKPTQDKGWSKRFDSKFKVIEKDASGTIYINWDLQPRQLKSFLQQEISSAYQKGRQDVLDELKEEQRKFTMGFSYKAKDKKRKG